MTCPPSDGVESSDSTEFVINPSRFIYADSAYQAGVEDEFFMRISAEYEMAREAMAIEDALKMEIAMEEEVKKRRIQLLHLFNAVKDTTQHMIGSLATLQRLTTEQVHRTLSLQ